MSHQATFWVLEFSKSRLADRLVLLAISYRVSNDDGDAWPSAATLQRESNICERQVYDSLKKLVADGELIIREEVSERGTNRYHMPKFLDWYNTLHKMQGEQKSPAQSSKRPLHKIPKTPAQNADESSLEPSKEQSSVVTPTKPSTKNLKPEANYKTFQSRYYKLVGNTPGKYDSSIKMYEDLCRDYGEERVLDCLSEWVESKGGRKKLFREEYGPKNFLEQAEIMLTTTRKGDTDDKEASYPHGLVESAESIAHRKRFPRKPE